MQSEIDFKFYIGCTSKILSKRLLEHNSGMVKSTRNRRPFKLVYYEKYFDKHKAFKREWFLKHPDGFLEKKRIVEKIKINRSDR